jgi:hypothetical protein
LQRLPLADARLRRLPPIAIGVDNNGIVGARRAGSRNQRRTPTIVNTAFYPKLMWNGRFFAPSGDPFDNSEGFAFPQPEGTNAFPPEHPVIRHLLIVQAHIPPTELTEAAGFTGTGGTIGPDFDQFDTPPPDRNACAASCLKACRAAGPFCCSNTAAGARVRPHGRGTGSSDGFER